MISSLINYIAGYISKRNKSRFLKDLKKLNFNEIVFFDIGAHQGEYSDIIIEEFTKKQLFLFEPLDKFYQFLKKKYKGKKYVSIFNKVVGEKNRKINFFISTHSRSSTKMKLNNKSKYYKIKKFVLKNLLKKKVNIQQIRLDNFINKVKKIDILKIDVEGNELNVLLGCKKILQKNKVKSIYIEILHHNLFKNYSSKKIHNFLIKNNFILYNSYNTRILFQEDRLYVNKNFV
tara:strand:- start:1352 stop:2047 length:696 start_codon:yes stop_codon:yes gene_type:complete